MLLPALAAVVVALACGGGDSTGPTLDSGAVDTVHIKLNYMCGNTFRARNYNNASVTVTWDVVGTTEQGTLVLPPKPADEGFSATLFTPQHVGTVRLLYQGQVLQSKENEGGPPCPAEPVGLQPPDSIPAWVYADSNIAQGSAYVSGAFVKSILVLKFRHGADLASRQAAIDAIHGVVVGGRRIPGAEGTYFVRLDDPGDGSALVAAESVLSAMPEVGAAALEQFFGPNFLRPHDGADWQSWRISPDNADGENWPQEQIAAPFAWGCTTGDKSAPIALIDIGFQQFPELAANIDLNHVPTYVAFDPFKGNDHGTGNLSILAARGNDSVGMTGVLWSAAVRVYSPPVSSMSSMIDELLLAGLGGAKAINFSQGIIWDKQTFQGNSVDSATALRAAREFRNMLDELRAAAVPLPLFVLSAGNDDVPAFFNGPAAVAGSSDSLNMLVIGASDRQRRRWVESFKASNNGPLVNLAAPGQDVYTRTGSGGIESTRGTSVAAPFVTGIAGLLLSFDPRLNGVELRQLILEGARRGGRYATGFTQPVLIPNAYESLRAAAERPGAPLCGNRVWSAGGSVFADRGGSAEQLFQLGEPGGYLTVYHGGRRVDVDVGHGLGRKFTFAGGSWSEVSDPSTLPRSVPSGASSSLFGFSHDRDTLLVPIIGGTPTTSTLGLSIRTLQQPDPPKLLGSVTVPKTGSTMVSQCRWREAQVRVQDSIRVFDHWACVDSVGVGSSEYVGATYAYSPAGDRILLAFNRRGQSASLSGTFGPCPWSTRGYNYNTDECLSSYTVAEQTTGSEIWEFKIASATSRSLFAIPGREVYSLAVGETGEEAALETNVEKSTVTSVPSDSVEGWVAASSTSPGPACQAEFRDVETGAPTFPAIGSADACSIAPAHETISPLRRASPADQISVITLPEVRQ